jgi:hypothetical protein
LRCVIDNTEPNAIADSNSNDDTFAHANREPVCHPTRANSVAWVRDGECASFQHEYE